MHTHSRVKTHPYDDYHEGDGLVREKWGEWGEGGLGVGGKVGKCRTVLIRLRF